MPDAAVHVEGVVKRFRTTTALAGVDLDVGEATVFGLLGPNGAGKTTLVRVLATLLAPDAGRAEVFGHDVVHDAARVRELVGLTGQFAAVDEMLTGRENLQMFGRLFDLSAADARRRATELLERFDLADAADRAARTRDECETRSRSAGFRWCSPPDCNQPHAPVMPRCEGFQRSPSDLIGARLGVPRSRARQNPRGARLPPAVRQA
jgi:ABC-type branched-subunit amino acid transport system ATPase component